MQDWTTDSHESLAQSLKTATKLCALEFDICTTRRQQSRHTIRNNRKPRNARTRIVVLKLVEIGRSIVLHAARAISTGAKSLMHIKRTGAVCAMLIAMCGCTTGAPPKYVSEIGIHAANYTEDYIHEFHLETKNRTNLSAGGSGIKQFSKGGTGGVECCSSIPGVGQTIKVVWQTGGYNDPESTWTTHTASTRTKGTTSDDPDTNTYLIIRFFPNDQVEAEYIAQSVKFGSLRDPRVDLLFTGQRVTRHVGE